MIRKIRDPTGVGAHVFRLQCFVYLSTASISDIQQKVKSSPPKNLEVAAIGTGVSNIND